MGIPVTAEGQVTIPEWVRDHLGLRPGDVVEFNPEEDGRVTLRQGEMTVDDFARRIASVRGLAKNPDWDGMGTDEIMRVLRGSPED